MDTSVQSSMNVAHDSQEWALRVDLAAAFRLAVQFGWHESVANHFSAAISDDGTNILLNPKWQHFSTIKASDLLSLDVGDEDVMRRDDAPDPSAWCIHGSIHAAAPQARVLLHCHPPYATALCALKDPEIKPVDQCTARFYQRVSIDLHTGGQPDTPEEGERIAAALGNHSVMMMGNHGVSVVGETVAEAFDDLYYLERASQTMVLAYSTGQELNVMSHSLAEDTAAGWATYRGAGHYHFEHLKRSLDATDPSYAH
jgi:ribulose-5-phosphate 4-epimerase/fuculose-1-phosphate aldolase